MYSSKQFEEHQPIEQTIDRDPTKLSLHNVKLIIGCFLFPKFFIFRHQN